MDGRRFRPLSDEALDRELEAALQVEPSPEYVARIRTRLASEPASSPWFDWWWVAGAAAAAAVLVLAFVAPWRGGDVAPPPREAGTLDVRLPTASAVRRGGSSGARVAEAGRLGAPSGPLAAEAGRSGGPSGPQAPDPTAAIVTAGLDIRPPFSEVVISEDEVRAYHRLIAAVVRREMPPLPADAGVERGPSGEVPGLQEIEPLVIEPLPQLARLEIGEHQ